MATRIILKVDHGTRLIGAYAVSDMATHDSQELETLTNKDDAGQKLYAVAYVGHEKSFKWFRMQAEVHEKVIRDLKLTVKQQTSNLTKSNVRVREEHVFGYITNSMNCMYIITIGFIREAAKIGLLNLTYSMMRFIQLKMHVQNFILVEYVPSYCRFYRGFLTQKVLNPSFLRINNDHPRIIRCQ